MSFVRHQAEQLDFFHVLVFSYFVKNGRLPVARLIAAVFAVICTHARIVLITYLRTFLGHIATDISLFHHSRSL